MTSSIKKIINSTLIPLFLLWIFIPGLLSLFQIILSIVFILIANIYWYFNKNQYLIIDLVILTVHIINIISLMCLYYLMILYQDGYLYISNEKVKSFLQFNGLLTVVVFPIFLVSSIIIIHFKPKQLPRQ